jgi:DnaJ-class molecular chaperone
MNPYDTLGIPRSSSPEDAKKAFRKLAMKYHPDRLADKSDKEKAEGEAQFKKYKEALEDIENPKAKPAQFQNFRAGPSDMEELLRGFKSMHAQVPARKTVVLNLQQAYAGGKVPLTIGSRSIAFNVPAGVPHLATVQDSVPVEDGERQVFVTFNIKDPKFSFKNDAEQGYMKGDLEVTVDVPAATMLLGGYIVVEDFLGAKLQVRVPQGFDSKHTLKVSKRGYAAWHHSGAPGGRGDLYVHVNPIRSTIAEMTMDEHQAIENAIQAHYKSITTQPLDERA